MEQIYAHRSRNVPQMTAGRAALVGMMDRYLRGLPAISTAAGQLMVTTA